MYTYKYTFERTQAPTLMMSTALMYVSVYTPVHPPDCVCANHMDKLGSAGFSALICSSVVTAAVPGVPWGGWEKLVSWSGSYYIPGVPLVLCTIRFRSGEAEPYGT